MAAIRVKRGTRAQVDAAAASSGLVAGEPYLITDDNVFAVGLSTTTYAEFVKPPPSDGSVYAYQNGSWIDITNRILEA